MSGNDDGMMPDLSDLVNMEQQARAALQKRMVSWGNSVRSEINRRRNGQWNSSQESVESASNIEGTEAAEQAIETSFESIQQQALELVFRYLELQQSPGITHDDLKKAGSELLVQLHDPGKREALLLTVKPEYRDDVRERFSEFSRLLWGVMDITQGRKSENYWYTLSLIAAFEGVDIREVVERRDDVDIADVPEWVLS